MSLKLTKWIDEVLELKPFQFLPWSTFKGRVNGSLPICEVQVEFHAWVTPTILLQRKKHVRLISPSKVANSNVKKEKVYVAYVCILNTRFFLGFRESKAWIPIWILKGLFFGYTCCALCYGSSVGFWSKGWL